MLKAMLGFAILVLVVSASYAGEWQTPGRPTVCDMPAGPSLEKCLQGVRTLMRPDNREASCCGEADAFITDNFEPAGNGDLWAIISADYPDTPGTMQDDGSYTATTFGLKRGDRILVPREKINTDQAEAWSSGHGVIFLRPSDKMVLCYRYPPLT